MMRKNTVKFQFHRAGKGSMTWISVHSKLPETSFERKPTTVKSLSQKFGQRRVAVRANFKLNLLYLSF